MNEIPAVPMSLLQARKQPLMTCDPLLLYRFPAPLTLS